MDGPVRWLLRHRCVQPGINTTYSVHSAQSHTQFTLIVSNSIYAVPQFSFIHFSCHLKAHKAENLWLIKLIHICQRNKHSVSSVALLHLNQPPFPSALLGLVVRSENLHSFDLNITLLTHLHPFLLSLLCPSLHSVFINSSPILISFLGPYSVLLTSTWLYNLVINTVPFSHIPTHNSP